MKLFFKELAFCAIVLLGAVPANGAEDTPNLELSFSTGLVSLPMVEMPKHAAHSCAESGRPVKIEIQQDLEINDYDVLQLAKTEQPKKKVVVRRAGKVVENTKESSARFDSVFVSLDSMRDAIKVELNAKLLFCLYSSFPEFVGAVYTLSGEIGQFRLFDQDAIKAKENDLLTISYQQELAESHWADDDKSPYLAVGELEFILDLKDLVARSNDGDIEVMIDVEIRGFVTTSLSRSES